MRNISWIAGLTLIASMMVAHPTAAAEPAAAEPAAAEPAAAEPAAAEPAAAEPTASEPPAAAAPAAAASELNRVATTRASQAGDVLNTSTPPVHTPTIEKLQTRLDRWLHGPGPVVALTHGGATLCVKWALPY